MIIEKLNNHGDLTAIEQSLKKFILERKEEVCYMSIQKLSVLTYTSTSTIMRFCRKMGADGFSDFKIKLKDDIVKQEQTGVLDDFDFPFSKNLSYKETASKLATLYLQSISTTQSFIDYRTINRLIQLSRKIDVIDIYGQGSSLSVAYEFKNKMLRLGKMVFLEADFSEQIHQAVNSKKNHLAIIISHSGANKETLQVARLLNDTDTPILSITRESGNELSKLSTFNLFTSIPETESLLDKMEIYSSHISTQYLLDYLYTTIYLFDFENNLKQTKAKEQILSKTSFPERGFRNID